MNSNPSYDRSMNRTRLAAILALVCAIVTFAAMRGAAGSVGMQSVASLACLGAVVFSAAAAVSSRS